LKSRSVLVRVSQLALLCMLIAVTAGATDSSARYYRDSHELMCGCGCNQLLGECNHVGCPASPGMLTELSAAIARGDSDDAILPPLVLFLGIAAVLLIVRNWKLRTVPTPPEPSTPGFAATRDRIRRETQI
jgi:hypothetical protein